ncbi:MAG TPA: GntR family transcriptional regulator [Hypericibacter adhaerens]|uniref:GntR family transcriptional regulator n=1 Tax=Hypericibacter adhaerens TaxID=2602016 RepID=A0A5J6MYU7_9PROT|nr:GntR family transcriptional regulator [Hypericibacter adhaerens]QEX22759.1 GntR family transcriptional regulator [Hypericibacter adhaerens]HWA42311.1 GntR family transcriptional regulator [Hypericibacter adhaerens]
MADTDLQISRQAATLRLMVEDKIRSAISTGRFRPGQRMRERELCELLGVGRTSVREALRQLEAEGLITTTPHRGPIVSTITYEEAQQLYAFRAVLESYAGQEFARRGSAAEMSRLAEAVAEFEKAASGTNQHELLEAKTHFYSTLMDGSGNVFVKQTLTQLHNRINLLRMTSMSRPGRLAHSVAEIKEILEAIRSRDAAKAAAACRHHIEMAAEAALAHLRDNPLE